MPDLEAWPRTRFADPAQTSSLANFYCGGAADYEQQVDEIVHELHAGGSHGFTIRVTEDVGSGELVGVCAFVARPLALTDAPPISDAACISLIAVHPSTEGPGSPT